MSMGSRIRSARMAAGMSQQALADEMFALGHGWHQSTVTRVENDERELRWREGHALQQLIQFDGENPDADVYRDAKAYRDILRIVGARKFIEQEAAS